MARRSSRGLAEMHFGRGYQGRQSDPLSEGKTTKGRKCLIAAMYYECKCSKVRKKTFTSSQ